MFRRVGLSLYAAMSNELADLSSLFEGKVLYLSALPHIYNSSTNLPVGFMSGYMNSQRNWLYKDLIYPSVQTASIVDTKTRLAALFNEVKDQDIRGIVGSPAIIQLITEKALTNFNIDHLQQLWKNLAFCVYGGNFLTQAQTNFLQKKWFGASNKKIMFIEQYSAVEGFFGHSFHVDWPGLVFNPFDVFYQFKKNENDNQFIQMHELEKDNCYFLYITPPAGLINYAMEDIIKITSVNPLTFKFLRRAKKQISLVSEKIIIAEIKQVIDSLAKQSQLPINDFVVYLNDKQKRLVFVLAVKVKELDIAIKIIDEDLRKLNPNYNEYRLNNTYNFPEILYKPPLFFKNYREKNIHKGNFKEKRLFMSAEDFYLEYSR